MVDKDQELVNKEKNDILNKRKERAQAATFNIENFHK